MMDLNYDSPHNEKIYNFIELHDSWFLLIWNGLALYGHVTQVEHVSRSQQFQCTGALEPIPTPLNSTFPLIFPLLFS